MRVPRIAAILFAVLAAAISLAACSAAAIPTTVPSNIAQLEASPMGAALHQYGYTPVANLYNNETHKVDGAVYVDCGTNVVNVAGCSSNLHNESTMNHPNVYVLNGKLVQLEGPHDGSMDDRNYYITAPGAYQNFDKLSSTQQRKLLGVMPFVSNALGDPSNGGYQTTLLLPIGETVAWVSR